MESEPAERVRGSSGGLGVAFAVLALLAASAAVVLGPAEGDASAEAKGASAASANLDRLQLESGSWARGECIDDTFDSFEDDDLSGDEPSRFWFRGDHGSAALVARLKGLVKSAPRGSNPARGPPSA
ncbi:MAG: hypothetical protein JRE81_06510 [Deltaproteobacteria bacterium]|jgi:hypothetical protein|nr:hypothetical protein [Deltaproteobacteria bacterium]